MLHASPSEVHRSRFLETCGRVCGWHVAYVLHPSYFFTADFEIYNSSPFPKRYLHVSLLARNKKQSFALAGQIKKKQKY